ncbi:hypothetical protein L7E55_07865 [Pelotomaculum isophthalicicum JI]|uniref:Uncharacterized protein n=1 Tax=Pelotomaculum isophthalicicum JI TaxID=947010 RepID=A0A9X4JU05_9FIRM|nr:hypothetical protein [Pelotomaculum isophthalicicum]MDF9408275.1 hypothetical protein [Pelotomaculum isophthalicicum JI]
MDILAGFMVFLALVGLGIALVLFGVKAITKKGWEYKKTGILAAVAGVLFLAGMVMAGPSVKQGFEAGRQAAKEDSAAPASTTPPHEEVLQEQKNEGEKNQAQQAEQSVSTKEEHIAKNEQDLLYEEWLKHTITSTIGESTNTDKPRIESVLFYNKEETEVEITLWADNNLTPGLIRDGAITKSTEVLHRIFSDSRAKRVLLYWLFPVKDSYGQERQMVLMQVIMTRETANKINWSGLSPLGLPNVADKFHIHPSLQ